MVKSDRIWRSEVAQSLLASTGSSTIEEAILRLVDTKLAIFGTLKPPIDLRMVASRFGISSHFNSMKMIGSARLRPDGIDKFVIDVNSLHNEQRQRFSIAHEIGHKALLDRGVRITKNRGSASYTYEQREEEEICDAIAATLLGLRPEFVRLQLVEQGFSFRAVEQMSRECNTSFEATLRAVLRHCQRSAAGLYCTMYGGLIGGIVDKFIVRRAYYSPQSTFTFSVDYVFSGVTCLREAMRQTGKVIASDETFAVNHEVHKVHAEAKRMTVYVDELPNVGVVMLLQE